MFGSLVYIMLDIGFNIISWGGVKTFVGLSNVFYYFYDNNNDNHSNNNNYYNKNLKLDNNKSNLSSDALLITKEDLNIIQEQISNQTKMIIELQNKLENQNDFELRFKKELENN